MTASPTDDPASAERRIQELTKELSQARSELAEGREQQAATAGILAALSSSPADLRRVCAEIAANAARLCDAHDAAIFQVEGDLLRLVAHHGPISTPSTLALTREVSVGRAVLDRRAIHVADLQAETDEYPEGSERARRDGVRSVLNVPLIPAGKTIGAILIRRTEARLFSDKQIALLQTFANQAVIAIENTRLFEAEQASKRELQESLEYQTAMSEVLGVISRSTFELQPVLEAVVESATRLCGAKRGHIFRFDGEYLRFAAAYGAWPGFTEYLKTHPSRPGRAGASERVALEGRTVHIADVLLDSEYERVDLFSEQGYRTVLAVPMLREGTLLGVIAILKTHVEPFTEKQIALVETFADQAVIAIENTRLFEAEQASKRELQESLQYQTATSEVLSVISRSKFELQPVLDTLVQSAVRLCQADRGFIWRLRGNVFQFAAGNKMAPEVANFALEHPPALDRSTAAGRSVLERRTIHIPDLREDPEYSWHGGQGERLGQYRTVLGVPLLRDGKPFGAFALLRGAPKPFSDKQIELVTTFADQAAIAIENTRLFEAEQASKLELQEALDYQTATSEVLNVISRSKFDLQPVLDSIAQTASGLCELADTAIMLREGNQLRTAAHYGSISTGGPRPIVRSSVPGRSVLDRLPVHVHDVTAARDEFPLAYEVSRQQHAHRTSLGIPLLHEDQAIGCLCLRRLVVQPFTDKQITLLQTFADQAVVAIENTRLFEEIARKSRELEIASQHKSQFVANMSHELRTPLAAILGYAELMQEGFYEPLGQKSLDALTRIRSNGKHLLGLINTVLDIAKIESGQFTLNMAEYAIESVVETVRSATESLAQNKKLALKTEVAKSLPVGLGDEQRLTQVLLNLVGNAIKFTDTGEVRVIAMAVNGHFNVSVADTGPGIPEEHQARIFEQFHQVDSSNTKAKGGTGLGLAIAKQIVEMHGGRIWVVSTPGKGSTFQLELPTRAEFRKPAQP